jgi:hypothetical protein
MSYFALIDYEQFFIFWNSFYFAHSDYEQE